MCDWMYLVETEKPLAVVCLEHPPIRKHQPRKNLDARLLQMPWHILSALQHDCGGQQREQRQAILIELIDILKTHENAAADENAVTTVVSSTGIVPENTLPKQVPYRSTSASAMIDQQRVQCDTILQLIKQHIRCAIMLRVMYDYITSSIRPSAWHDLTNDMRSLQQLSKTTTFQVESIRRYAREMQQVVTTHTASSTCSTAHHPALIASVRARIHNALVFHANALCTLQHQVWAIICTHNMHIPLKIRRNVRKGTNCTR